MLRKPNKAQATQPPWRPDFRSKEHLPDIKVVRTDFMLNVVAIAIAVILVGFLVYREYTASTLERRVASLTTQVDAIRGQDRQNVAASAAFTREMVVAEDAATFVDSPVDAPRMLMEFSRMLPEQGRFSSIVLQEMEVGERDNPDLMYRVTLGGAMSASGTRKAVQLIDDYIRALRELETFAPYMRRVELVSAERNAGIDQFVFSIVIDLSAIPATES